MPEPAGLVVKKGTNRLWVSDTPGPSSVTEMSTWRAEPAPADLHPPAGLHGRVDAVLDQVDQNLFQLVGVAGDGQLRSGQELDRQAFLQLDDPMQQGAHLDRGEAWAAAASPAGRTTS